MNEYMDLWTSWPVSKVRIFIMLCVGISFILGALTAGTWWSLFLFPLVLASGYLTSHWIIKDRMVTDDN